MNENLNLVELLKDCPKGTKFYTPIYGEVEFDNIDNGSNFPIRTKDKQGTHVSFTKEGYFTYTGTPECMLFPSKDQRDWSKYQRPFVNGDIITSKAGGIALFSHTQSRFECSNVVYYHCVFYYYPQTFKLGLDYGIGCISDCRFATKEEKQRLFQAIKDNGYKWNANTKTLEKLITPKFRIGDIIQDEDSYKVKITAINEDGLYDYESLIAKGIGAILFEEQDDWTLVEYQVGDYVLALNHEIYRISKINPNSILCINLYNGHTYFNQKEELTKIDKYPIENFKPFDKVLVRGSDFMTWKAMPFSYYDTMTHKFITHCGWKQCIPYNHETEHLVGTCFDCPEFYKNW